MGKGSRNFEEKSENMETIKNDAPESKFQNDQQIADSTGFKVDAGKSNFKLEKKKAPGSTLKQEVAASVVKDASYGGSLSGDGASFVGTKSSGSVGGVLGASNATPVAGKARSEGRTSKKLDRNSTKLNFIPNEQVLVEWDESKPLADSADQDQGFNGTYRNEFARSQKKVEAVPGALMFDRSIDLLVKDNLYFGEGQKVAQTGVTSDEDMDCTMALNSRGVYSYTDENGNDIPYAGGKTGNYLLSNVQALFDSNGVPVYTVYNDTDLSQCVDEHIANKSSAQDHILMNDAELCRESIDTKAGDEKADLWSPLARAVQKPTALAGYLRDLEATVGNEILTAYRKFSTSMSFQLNRAHKDGQNIFDPAILANRGLNTNFVSSDAAKAALGTKVRDALFNRNAYINGAASTMVALYDSVSKYNNKADFLVQPRAYRMHLQTADNNIDPLKVNKLFNQAYSQQEVFSTIDKDYDPMSPVCLSDKAGVISRLSHHKTGSFVNSEVTFTVSSKTAATQGSEDHFYIMPEAMVKEVKAAGYDFYVIYPHEAAGNLDNYSNGKLSADSTYEFANGAYFKVLIGNNISTFSTSVPYVVGDIVVHSNGLYTCTVNHAAGSWASGHFTRIKDASNKDLDCLIIANANIYDEEDFYFEESGAAPSSKVWAVQDCTVAPNSTKIYAYNGGPLRYGYDDLRNNYVITVKNPLTEGLDKYFRDGVGAKYHSLITESGNRNSIITIRTVHSTMYFSLWSIMLCAATPYIIKERINSFRDVLYYEKNVEYPFSSTLCPIKDCLTRGYTNFTYINYDTELSSKVMTPATALTWILPETYQQVGYMNSNSLVLMPWYTNQSEIYSDGTTTVFVQDRSAMSFPSIRSGVRLGSLDTLYGMSEKDIRLSIDKVSSYAGLNPTLADSATYKYSSVGDGQMILSIAPADMTAKNIMTLPRELGFFMTAPYGVLTPDYNHAYNINESVLGTSSFRCYYWLGDDAVTTDNAGNDAILLANAINVNRAANFTQDWFCILASGTLPPVDHGFILSANQAFSATGALLNGRSSFKPYAALTDEVNGTISTATYMNAMRSTQKYLWTRIQKLPFVISPFDGLAIDNSNNPNSTIITDPYDLLYVFGLGGFRASDFRESVYNREKEVVNQGLLFVSDPWIEDSPVFKEGALSSGTQTTKGFELV